MKHREKIIALLFCLGICCISGSTLVSKWMTAKQPKESVSEDKEPNTIAESHEMEKQWQAESRQNQKADKSVEEKDTSFLGKLKGAADSFTDDLSGKEEGAEISSRISSAASGGSYIESRTVLLGKDNWLFYKASDDGDSIADYRGTNHYPKEKMKNIKVQLEKQQKFFAGKGIQLLFFIVPNKESVYAEQMPDHIKRKTETTRADKFARYLQENSELDVVYPKKELMAAKQIYPTYYKTDTHWNQVGAFVGIQCLKEYIDGDFQSVTDVKFVEKKKNYAGDLAKLCKMTDKYNDDIKYALKSSSVDQTLKSKKKLLIIGDSFSDLMPEIARQYFKQVRTAGIWNFKLSDLEKEKPDVIVWECNERYLDRYDWLKLTTR